MVSGPRWNLPPGSYLVDFILRARAPHHSAFSTSTKLALPEGEVCEISAWDLGPVDGPREEIEFSGGWRGELLQSRVMHPGDFGAGNSWTRASLPISIRNALNQVDMRVVWRGNAALDIASLAIRDAPP